MDNIIKIVEIKGEDPILRKGNLVRLVIAEPNDDPDYNLDLAEHCLGYCGFVTEVHQRYGEDSVAPNQAMIFSVAFPFEEGWEELANIELPAIHRILGQDLEAGYGVEEAHGNE